MILKNCDKCRSIISERLYQLNNWICNNCKNTNTKNVEVIKEIEVTKSIEVTSQDKYNWLPVYTSSYLHNKLNINLNSIKNQKVCVKYKDKYILHEDIINQFKDSIDK